MPLPPELDPILQMLAGLTPTESDIGIMVYDITTGGITPLASTTIPSVPGVRESYTETYEVGWQGVLANKFSFSADVYYTKKNDFVSPLLVQTPLLTLNGQDIASYVTVPIVTALTQQLMGLGLPFEQAQAQATALAGQYVPLLAEGLAGIPVGVVSSDQVAAKGADVIVTYRNVGDVDLWGADLGFKWFAAENWTVSGSYSHVSKDYFQLSGGTYISLNAPKDKGALGVAYRNGLKGINAEARVRHTGEFPAESAGYVGTACVTGGTGGIFEEDCVKSATLFDVNFGYQIPTTNATVQFSVTNLFDGDYRSFVGVPNIGRFAMVGLKYDLF
jgi:iron complex outermembrane receptor protein